MLKRIYVNNYKSLVNFEIALDSLSSFLGENGTGKTSVFEVLTNIQAFLLGYSKVADLFPLSSITRWSKSTIQSIEIDVIGDEGLFNYTLEIEHNLSEKKARVSKEKLTVDGKPLFHFSGGNAQLYHDDHTEGPNYPADWSKSSLGSIPSRNDNKKLTWFKNGIWHFLILRLNPYIISDIAVDNESAVRLNYNGSNFASWYQYISNDQSIALGLTEELREVLDGFSHFRFAKLGENQSVLLVCFDDDNKNSYSYRLTELSDGQRMLIVLYTLLYTVRTGDFNLLCIDEPFNHLSLPEIQPWLVKLNEYCMDESMQSIIISHHPEPIDYLAAEVGYWFEREGQRPTRIRRITSNEKNDGILFSDLIKRGWLYGKSED